MATTRERVQGGFTLVEMLVVLALIGMLSSILAVAIMHVRAISIRTECQKNLQQIGQALVQVSLSNGGRFPKLVGDDGVPWWVKVAAEFQDETTLYRSGPLPASMGSFQCRSSQPIQKFHTWNTGAAAGGTTTTLTVGGTPWTSGEHAGRWLRMTAGSMEGLKRVIVSNTSSELTLSYAFPQAPAAGAGFEIVGMHGLSYGINFDERADSGKPYHANWSSLSVAEQAKYANPGAASAADKEADEYYYTQIKQGGKFILLSEANVETSARPTWTGGRISMDATGRTPADDPPYAAPIVGRHKGMANVLYADLHLDIADAPFRVDASTDTVVLLEGAKNINTQTRFWTLPDE